MHSTKPAAGHLVLRHCFLALRQCAALGLIGLAAAACGLQHGHQTGSARHRRRLGISQQRRQHPSRRRPVHRRAAQGHPRPQVGRSRGRHVADPARLHQHLDGDLRPDRVRQRQLRDQQRRSSGRPGGHRRPEPVAPEPATGRRGQRAPVAATGAGRRPADQPPAGRRPSPGCWSSCQARPPLSSSRTVHHLCQAGARYRHLDRGAVQGGPGPRRNGAVNGSAVQALNHGGIRIMKMRTAEFSGLLASGRVGHRTASRCPLRRWPLPAVRHARASPTAPDRAVPGRQHHDLARARCRRRHRRHDLLPARVQQHRAPYLRAVRLPRRIGGQERPSGRRRRDQEPDPSTWPSCGRARRRTPSWGSSRPATSPAATWSLARA